MGKYNAAKTHCKNDHEYSEENTYYRKDGRGRQCRKCKLARQMKLYWADPRAVHERINRARRSENPPPSSSRPRQRKYFLKGVYNLTVEDYDSILASQDYKCAICGTDEPGGRSSYFAVDHNHRCCSSNHSCGKCVRGLLCTKCNTGLGMFNDDREFLLSALRYLDG